MDMLDGLETPGVDFPGQWEDGLGDFALSSRRPSVLDLSESAAVSHQPIEEFCPAGRSEVGHMRPSIPEREGDYQSEKGRIDVRSQSRPRWSFGAFCNLKAKPKPSPKRQGKGNGSAASEERDPA